MGFCSVVLNVPLCVLELTPYLCFRGRGIQCAVMDNFRNLYNSNKYKCFCFRWLASRLSIYPTVLSKPQHRRAKSIRDYFIADVEFVVTPSFIYRSPSVRCHAWNSQLRGCVDTLRFPAKSAKIRWIPESSNRFE